MATRRLRKNKSRRRGGAMNTEDNIRNCQRYWGGKEGFCKKYTGIINFPGLVNKMKGDQPRSKKDNQILVNYFRDRDAQQ